MSTRLAIVGMGGRGLKLLAHLVDQPDQDVVGVADRSAVAYARLQAELYDRRVHILREAVDLLRLEPDVIVVATTAAGHAPVVRSLVDAGYDGALFVEKPLAASVAEGRELERLLDRRPRVAIGFQRRGSTMYAEAVRTLRSGELGAVRSLRWGPPIPSQISMKGAHHFDLANWLTGERPVAVSAQLDEHPSVDRRGAYYFDPPGHARVQYESGAVFEVDSTGETPDGLFVECEQGSLRVGPEEDALAINGPEGERTVASDGGREESFDWFDATLRAVVAGEPGPCTPAEALDALEVVAAVFLSNERGGERVPLPLGDADSAQELRIA
ncbi:MAG: Gfo/Idh/MocA family protein [Verrucomicrobiota bacterium]